MPEIKTPLYACLPYPRNGRILQILKHPTTRGCPLRHEHQQLRLQDVFPLLVFLIRLIRLIVLPPHRLLALPARNIPHYVSTGRHVAFCGFALGHIHDGVEEVGFAVLAPEALRWAKMGQL